MSARLTTPLSGVVMAAISSRMGTYRISEAWKRRSMTANRISFDLAFGWSWALTRSVLEILAVWGSGVRTPSAPRFVERLFVSGASPGRRAFLMRLKIRSRCGGSLCGCTFLEQFRSAVES
jgi:hypothetical protein